MAYVLNEAIHQIFHFLSYNVVDLVFLQIPFVTNLGISPSPKIVMKIIGSSYILFFFKQLDLGSILASLNLSRFAEAFFFFFKHKQLHSPVQNKKPSKEAKLISVQLRMLIYMVYIISYQTDLKYYKYHDRIIEMWKYLKKSSVEKANQYRVLSIWLI